MREGIHPNYYQAKVVCNCGNEFVTGSTKEEIHVEICSKCHSFYTAEDLHKSPHYFNIYLAIRAQNSHTLQPRTGRTIKWVGDTEIKIL